MKNFCCTAILCISLAPPLPARGDVEDLDPEKISKRTSFDFVIYQSDPFYKVYYVDDPFIKKHLRALPKEEFDSTGYNYEYCDGNKIYLEDPKLVEDPIFDCEGRKGKGSISPWNLAADKIQKGAVVYDSNYSQIGELISLTMGDSTIKGTISLDSTYLEKLDAFRAESIFYSASTGNGLEVFETSDSIYLVIQNVPAQEY